jgi:hypothetical protein
MSIGKLQWKSEQVETYACMGTNIEKCIEEIVSNGKLHFTDRID